MNNCYIVAGSYRSMREWLDSEADPKRKYIYVAGVHTLFGASLTEDNIVFLNDSGVRHDIEAIRRMVKERIRMKG